MVLTNGMSRKQAQMAHRPTIDPVSRYRLRSLRVIVAREPTYPSMTAMTKEEGRLFKERWRLVNEFTNEEARRKDVMQRLQELEALHAFAQEIDWANRETEVEVVRARWNRLREKLGV